MAEGGGGGTSFFSSFFFSFFAVAKKSNQKDRLLTTLHFPENFLEGKKKKEEEAEYNKDLGKQNAMSDSRDEGRREVSDLPDFTNPITSTREGEPELNQTSRLSGISSLPNHHVPGCPPSRQAGRQGRQDRQTLRTRAAPQVSLDLTHSLTHSP